MKIIISPTENQAIRSPESRFNTVTVETDDDELAITEVLELFKCALLAWQYSPDNIEKIKMVENGR